tara:strand:+ start:1823 stop:2092 length:270 start_codon:yes stop_codon:yes gene_type:complete
MNKGVTVLKQNCDPKEAEDRSLPYICYLISYNVDGKVTYDLAMTGKEVDLFDYYYDLYGKDFIEFKQSEGRVNPKLWVDPKAPKAKRGK